MFEREIASPSSSGQATAPSTGLPPGTTGVAAWILLSLAAVFPHDASSRVAEPAGTGPVQAHVRLMDSRVMFTGGMFPRLDPQNRGEGDLELVAGKSPIGMRSVYMLRDDVTAVGLTTTHVGMKGSSGVRLTGLWAFEPASEADTPPYGNDVNLLGLLAEGEFPWGLLSVGVARTFTGWHRSEEAGGGVGPMAHFASGSYAANANLSRYADPTQKKYDGGYLLTIGYSREVGLRRDILYANGYWTDGDFGRLASNGPSPTRPAGLSFSDVATGDHRQGRWPGRLDSTGFAVGMQTSFADDAANWAVELGHRQHLDTDHVGLGNTGGTSLTTRARYRFAERFLLQLDAYYAINGPDTQNRRHQDAESGADSSALRVELRVSF